MPNEEQAIVLDFLPHGRSSGFKAEPYAIVLGTSFFTLLEVVPKVGVALKIMDSVYVGQGDRPHIELVRRRIDYKDLTNTAQGELEKGIEKIVNDHPERFLQFFNRSQPISLKRHRLELLPGMGKKHFLEVLKERETQPFSSLDDIRKRLPNMANPVAMIVKRVMEELEGDAEKHYLFTRPPTGFTEENSPFSRLGYRR